MKKKLTALALVVVMVAMLFTGLTMAYFTDTDEATNTFTVGDISIDLWETDKDGNKVDEGDAEGGLTFENVVPGVKYPKDPTVTNTSKTNKAYVRMTICFSNGVNSAFMSGHELTDFLNGLSDKWTLVKEHAQMGGTHLGHDDANCWYAVFTYNEVLEPETDTTALFTDFMIPADMTQDYFEAYVNNPFEIIVTAEAIQADGFNSVEEAWAGFEGATVDTLKDGDVIQPIEAGDKVVLNLNGNTVKAVAGEKEALINNGEATIKNGTIEAGSPADYASITLGVDAETIYNEVTIKSKGGGVGAADGAKVTFNSGSVYVDTASTSGRYIFYAEGEGTEITINGGEFSWDPADNQKRAYIYAGAGTTVYVNGGTFGKASTRSGYTDGILGDGSVVIKGGTFGFDPTKWVADGYVATEAGGVWTVTAQ